MHGYQSVHDQNPLLVFGETRRQVATPGLHNLAQFLNVLSKTHERQGDIIRVLRQREGDVRPVFVGNCR